MNLRIIIATILLALAGSVSTAADKEAATQAPGASTLWYTQPAKEWTQTLPIGNGRLGAMVYGGIEQEHLQLNKDILWCGGPHNDDNPEAYPHLATARQQLNRGEFADAEATAGKTLGKPKYQRAYMLLGDLFLDHQDVSDDPLKKVGDDFASVGEKSFAQLRQRHVNDYSQLFGRAAIDLGGKRDCAPAEAVRSISNGRMGSSQRQPFTQTATGLSTSPLKVNRKASYH